MDYLLPLWLRQYLTQRQRRGTSEIPEDVADHLLALCAEALQDRDPATLSHPRTHSIQQSFSAILRQKSSSLTTTTTTTTTTSTSRSKFPFGSSVSVFRKLAAQDLDPLNSQEIVRLAIYVMKRSTLEFIDPLTSERVHTEGERKNSIYTNISANNQRAGTVTSTKTGLMAAADIYLCKDFHIGQAVLHNDMYPLSRANKSVISLALFCARASGLRSKSAETYVSTTMTGYPLTALASMAGAKWLAKLGQVMFGGPCAQQGHNHHRRTRASLDLLERQNVELGQKILAEQQNLDPATQGRRGSVVQTALTPPEANKAKDLSSSSSSSDFVPLSSIRPSPGSLSHSTSTSNISIISSSASSSGGPALDKWCRHCSRAMSCLVLAQLQESLGVDDIVFDDSGFAVSVLSNAGFELLNSRSSSSSSLMDMPSQSSSMGSSGFLGSNEGSGTGSGRGNGRNTNGYRDPRPHLLHKSELLNNQRSEEQRGPGGNRAPSGERSGSPFIAFDHSHKQDENEPPSSIPSPLLAPSTSGSTSALTQSLADAFESEMSKGLRGRALRPQSNRKASSGGLSSSPTLLQKLIMPMNNLTKHHLELANRNNNITSNNSLHPLEHGFERQSSVSSDSSKRTSNSRKAWEEQFVEPQKTKLELDLAEAVSDMSPVLATQELKVVTVVHHPSVEPVRVTREVIEQTGVVSPTKSFSSAASDSPPSFSASARKKKKAAVASATKKDIKSPASLIGLGLEQSSSSLSSTDPVSSLSAEEEEVEESPSSRSPTESLSSPAAASSSPVHTPVPVPQPPSDSDRTNPKDEIKGEHAKGVETADVTQKDTSKPKTENENENEGSNQTSSQSSSPVSSASSASSSSSSSPSSSSGTSSSSASSFRSASEPNSPTVQGTEEEEQEDEGEQGLDSSVIELEPESRPHTPGAYPPCAHSSPLSRLPQEESDDDEIKDSVEEESEESNKEKGQERSPFATRSAFDDESPISSKAATSASFSPSSAPSSHEYHPFYAVGIHGQASMDSYAREIEESIKRKTPPQDTGSRRASAEQDLEEEEDGPSSPSSLANEEKVANPQVGTQVGGESVEHSSGPKTEEKETLSLKEPLVVETTPTSGEKATLVQQKFHVDQKTVAQAQEEGKKGQRERPISIQEGYKADEETGSEPPATNKDDRPISSISTSSSMVSEDSSASRSSPIDEDDQGDHDVDNDDDSGGGDGSVFDLSSAAIRSSSSLLSSSSSHGNLDDDKPFTEKRQAKQLRRKKRLLVDDSKRKQEQLDKIKAQLQLKTLGKIRQQVSFWEEKGVLEQKVVGVVEVEEEPVVETEGPSNEEHTHRPHQRRSSKEDSVRHEEDDGGVAPSNVDKADKVPLSAPPTSQQRN